MPAMSEAIVALVDDARGRRDVRGARRGDRGESDLPVGVARHGGVEHVAGVLGRIGAADGELAGAGLVLQVESEHVDGELRSRDELLHDGRHGVDRDRGEGEPEQAIELRRLELRALAEHFSEGDSRREVAHTEDVLREEALARARAVLDGEGLAIGHVGRRGCRVVLGGGGRAVGAGGARQPQVGGASVEIDLESLRRRAQRDCAVVVGVGNVREGDRCGAGGQPHLR
eukprot:scaffold93649_cov69-Phaeocystis_antarctica.AAC.5